jgi:hypothetical protein
MKKIFTILVALSILLSILGDAGASTTITLQADADTHVRTDQNARRNDNYGECVTMAVGDSRGGGGISYGDPDGIRSLISFDLSGVALAEGHIAILELTVTGVHNIPNVSPQTYQMDVHRIIDSDILTPWVEGNGCTVSVDAAYGVAWVGVDANNQTQPNFDSAVEASVTIDESTSMVGDVFQWDITSLVNDWISDPSTNYGIMLRDLTTPDSIFKHVFIATRENQDYNGPRLIIGPLCVNIDIKPGSDPNCFNLNGHGVIPVAILGSSEFDVTQIEPYSLSFAELKARVRGKKGPLCHYEHVNDDGYLDMVCQFEDNVEYWVPGEGVADLTGELMDGTEFEGTDSICVVP